MQTVNNYDKNVYNGDIGRITAMDLNTTRRSQSASTARLIVYDFLEADELMHAYAISVHKSQGSEYPCVVMPIMTQHYLLLQRNLAIYGRQPGKEAGHPGWHPKSHSYRHQKR